jgi:(p)ppGpp synthase/HD superfamily hydrolase
MDFKEKKQKAIDWATHAHVHLTKSGSPQLYKHQAYTVHLKAVESVLMRFGIDPSNGERDQALLVSAWLHDTLEDTSVSYEEINKELGENIASLVFCVTDETGQNRKERKLKTYPKLKKHPYAVILKLADRIANVEASLDEKDSTGHHLQMYKKEYPDFKSNLYTPGLAEDMWVYLDNILK